ncbi:MAG: hypothetical protein H6636_10325 [Anaerolineales bacterium]|nr:hypothetical protein [Anaerolineales bacterium]
MGRTLQTINQIILEEQRAFADFRRALRREDQHLFDALFASARQHMMASSLANHVLDAYRVKSSAARAATQLEEAGKPTRLGQPVRFLFTRRNPRVYARDLPIPPDPAMLDVPFYAELLLRAANTFLWPDKIENLYGVQGNLL